MKPSEEELRNKIANVYKNAVNRPAGGGCHCNAPVQKGVVAKLGGYSSEELSALPTEAVVNSFGCGNPVALAELRPGEIVLDLGSGAGIDLLLAAKKVGPSGRVIGIDMTDEMIGKAQENIRAGGFTNVEVRKGVIENLPVESSSVDWVISNCVINLSPDKLRVFHEIARVLKPGGRMLVSDIVAKDLPEKIRHDPALSASCVAGAISEEEYLAGLRVEGLADLQVRERFMYDETQLEAFFGCYQEGKDSGGVDASRAAATLMSGKVWSAKVYGRKLDGNASECQPTRA